MSLLEIEEKFRVAVPVERVWKFLLDPRQVVVCLPGAELTRIVDERNFEGNMKVKVGPVTMVYKGRMTITEVDESARRVKMVGEGVDKGGAGTAKMSMESTMLSVDGGTEVSVVSKVDLAGKIVQFGRGMIKSVSALLFKQFADSARKKLETDEAAPNAAPAPAPSTTSTSPSPSPSTSSPANANANTNANANAPATPDPVPDSDPVPGSPTPETPKSRNPEVPNPVSTALAAPLPLPPPSKPVSGLSLLFRALASSIADFFRRLFRRSSRAPRPPSP